MTREPSRETEPSREPTWAEDGWCAEHQEFDCNRHGSWVRRRITSGRFEETKKSPGAFRGVRREN